METDLSKRKYGFIVSSSRNLAVKHIKDIMLQEEISKGTLTSGGDFERNSELEPRHDGMLLVQIPRLTDTPATKGSHSHEASTLLVHTLQVRQRSPIGSDKDTVVVNVRESWKVKVTAAYRGQQAHQEIMCNDEYGIFFSIPA